MRKEKGNGYLLEFECDRCRTKFWDKGGWAQIDCPVCTPKKLSNHPVITGRSQKEVKCKNCMGRGLVAMGEGVKGLAECVNTVKIKGQEKAIFCRIMTDGFVGGAVGFMTVCLR